MSIRPLKCPLNENHRKPGPITNTFYSQYPLTDEEIRLYERLALLPKPSIRRRAKKKTEEEKASPSPSETPPETAPDFHPIDCPAQFPSEPE
jgi:hypothetical protein